MNILLYDMSSFIQKDLIYYLTKAGHHCRNIRYKFVNKFEDAFFEYKWSQCLKSGNYDFVMSTNFYPLVAKACFNSGIPYLSWIYDSPLDCSQISYFQYPTNYVFIFDRLEAEKILQKGGINIYHLPLAINTDRLDSVIPSMSEKQRYQADVSFVGSFYNDSLNQIRYFQDNWTKGYLDSMVQTQLQIYGYNFLPQMITSNLLDRINTQLKRLNITPISKSELELSVEKQITYIERTALCNLLGTEYNVKFYSSSDLNGKMTNATWMGTAHYFSEMPKIFKCSRLNLNSTLRSIQSGIPLRALDIMGCGATLLSNYQPELAEYFTDQVDILLYDSLEDAIDKANFYLHHEDLCTKIGQQGYAKVKESFTYPSKIEYMLKVASL